MVSQVGGVEDCRVGPRVEPRKDRNEGALVGEGGMSEVARRVFIDRCPGVGVYKPDGAFELGRPTADEAETEQAEVFAPAAHPGVGSARPGDGFGVDDVAGGGIEDDNPDIGLPSRFALDKR